MKIKLIFSTVFLMSLNVYGFSKKPQKVQEQVVQTVSAAKQTLITSSLKDANFQKSLTKVLKEQQAFSRDAVTKAFTFLDLYGDDITKADSICLSSDNKRNRTKIRNKNCLVVADYTKNKKNPRLLLINPFNGDSELFYTAHGKGSHNPEEIETGEVAKRFSNKSGSNMTSLGFYLTDFLYTSQKDTFGPGPSNGLKLDGINCSNNNAKKRYIVMHTADYVPSLKSGPDKIGNSEGCVTFPEKRSDVLKKCRQGALVYAFYQ
jgi:hypothetical protein